MIDLTPLLERLDERDVPYEDDPVELLEAKFDNLDRIVLALVAYLGVQWCDECADLHLPDSHSGSNMGFPSMGLGPEAPPMGP